ncbi:MAG: hypothetical protein H6908_01410 [Hyphomicrobiales bacterium]|nr:hypothetical protein [Hyphomicrobiales bacterium]
MAQQSVSDQILESVPQQLSVIAKQLKKVRELTDHVPLEKKDTKKQMEILDTTLTIAQSSLEHALSGVELKKHLIDLRTSGGSQAVGRAISSSTAIVSTAPLGITNELLLATTRTINEIAEQAEKISATYTVLEPREEENPDTP